MPERIIPVDYKEWKLDVACQYEERGDIATVCLHGLQSNKVLFSAVLERCSHKNLSAFAIDFIGFGNSSKPENFLYRLEDQAAIIKQVVSRLRLQKFFLIGHSMGGMVGTMLLRDWQEQLLGFINMEGNFTLVDCGASLLATQMSFEEFSQTSYPGLIASLKSSQEPSARMREQWLQSTPSYAFYHSSRSIVEWSESKKLIPMFANSPVEKLFVYGEKNRRKKDALSASIACAEIVGSGHFMLADNPRDTLETIHNFIDRFS